MATREDSHHQSSVSALLNAGWDPTLLLIPLAAFSGQALEEAKPFPVGFSSLRQSCGEFEFCFHADRSRGAISTGPQQGAQEK